MTTKTTESNIKQTIADMFKAGAHFGFSKSRRHPSFKSLIFGAKNNTEILDLEITDAHLEKTLEYVSSLGAQKKTILFVSSKSEAKDIVRRYAEKANLPYVAGRWIGGTLTNFPEIKKRVAKLEDLTNKKEKNELLKYTKKERLLIDREIDRLNEYFSGIRGMSDIPSALFIIDAKKEDIAVTEAKKMHVPVISLSSTDCDLTKIDFPIPGNDASKSSIEFFVNKVTEAYLSGKETKKA